MPAEPPLVLFDGVCNVCNAAVNFVLDHEAARDLRFASLQSAAGRAACEAHGLVTTGDPDSMLFVEEGRAFDRSTAVLRIARHLRWPYRALAALVVVPRPLRDLFYRWFARHRYAWFGKAATCRVPTPELRERFLD